MDAPEHPCPGRCRKVSVHRVCTLKKASGVFTASRSVLSASALLLPSPGLNLKTDITPSWTFGASLEVLEGEENLSL